jgi:ABC-type transport system involved in multi-copper enzyme maturation permease subunit
MDWYSQNVTAVRNHPSTVATNLLMQPNPLLFISEGGDKYRPHSYSLSPKGALSPTQEEARNYKMPEVPEIDWSFIIKILFSLYVILLGYNSVSGEKEQGTLRLMLSHPLGRLKLLIAKYIAIMITVAVPLLIGILISLIIVGISIPSILTIANFSRIFLILILTLMYLSIFAFLSLLVSSFIHDSSVVLLSLLVVWVLFAIVIPNTAGIISEKFSTVPSEYKIAKEVMPVIQQEVFDKIGKIRDRVNNGEIKTEEEIKLQADMAFDEGQEELIRHNESYFNAMKERADLAQNISRLSPTSLFQYASEGIAESGQKLEEKFISDAKEYGKVYDDYILEKMGKVVGVSNWSFGTNMMLNGKSIGVNSPRPQEYRGDKSDFPQFKESQSSILESINDALADLTGLVLWNIILAAGAFLAILKSDVR